MAQPHVSIALTTCNGEKYLRNQLDSLYAQTHRNLEVVATDDCSNDGTHAILEEYRDRYGLRFVVNDRRLGFLKNFEKAISFCTGDFIALADQDDIWLPQKIETLLGEIGACSLICSDVSLVDEHGRKIAHSFRERLHIPIPPREKQFYTLAFINFVTGCTCLFSRGFVEKILPIPTEALSHDWWIGIRAALSGGIKYLREPLVQHRQHQTNAIGVEELWKITGKVQYLLSKERRQVFEKERTRIQYYLDHGVYADEQQRSYLQELLRHYESILTTRIHLEAFRIAYKYRNEIFHDLNPLAKYSYILGRLI